jgi:NAD(P)-dependent dehydrogenase (short-subunit alcohol dehydrogenase family)
MRLKDKVTIVTGAAMGIGAACARRFAREGAQVVVADIDASAGAATADAIKGDGGEATFVACDVGDRGEVEAMIARAVERYGPLDTVVSNAGILQTGDFLELTEEDFDRVIRVNLKGMFLVGQASARQMVKQGTGGAIINMSSVNAIMAIPSITPYVVSKGGINQLTRVMAIALADAGIRVNAIGPGSIATEMIQKVMQNEEARRTVLSRTPLGRLGDPDEVAAVATFLAGDDASYITGQVIYVDGGRLPLNYTVPVKE